MLSLAETLAGGSFKVSAIYEESQDGKQNNTKNQGKMGIRQRTDDFGADPF